jgi:glycosyltransferase involved in cell wall biosynthesis
MCPLLRTRKGLPFVFFDLDDIEHVVFKRGFRYLRRTSTRLLNYLLFPTLCRGEIKAIQLAHRTFVCSDKDQEYLTNRWGLKGVVKVPNAIKIPLAQPITPEQTLLFLGSYNYKPNVDAAEFLIQKIWPLIHRELPKATLTVAGSPSDSIPSFRAGIKGVRFTGFVEDLDSLYRQSRVVCVPILSGGGTRVKIIEAAAYGKPIVSTNIGAEGLQMRDDHDIVIRDDPELFAEACIKLLKDLETCHRLGSAARATVVKQYDQLHIKGLIQKIIKESL